MESVSEIYIKSAVERGKMPPEINLEACTGCGICIYECGGFCLSLDSRKIKARLSNGRTCVDCFRCEASCPDGAISIKIKK